MPIDGSSATERFLHDFATKQLQERAELRRLGYSVSEAHINGKFVGWTAGGLLLGNNIRGWWRCADDAWAACKRDHEQREALANDALQSS